MRVALGLGAMDRDAFYIDCSEMHAHTYTCLSFKDKPSAIYLRLIEEVERYQRLLDKLQEQIGRIK